MKKDMEKKNSQATSDAILQSVATGIVFINTEGVVEKINTTLEILLGQEIVKTGTHISELPPDNIIRELFLKPLESGSCWEMKNCSRQHCFAYGRKDCVCWLTDEASSFCSTVFRGEKSGSCELCELYVNARRKYYTTPNKISFNKRFFHVFRRHVIRKDGVLLGDLLDFIDMTSEKSYIDRLQTLSITDGLTGLYNRRYLTDRMIEEFYESRRYNSEMSLLLLDIDDFKLINDTFGHPIGDVVLRELAFILKDEVRKSDVAGRYGGEEFLIIMPHTAVEEAFRMAERIRLRIEAYKVTVLPEDVPVTISIGLASTIHKTLTVGELLKIVDKALYEAKGKGKNRTVKA